jgi:hypothetical protein
MNPLSDDELSDILQQAKRMTPEPSPEFAARALGEYQSGLAGLPNRRPLWLRPVSIPLPLVPAAALFLLLVGALGGLSFRRPPIIVRSPEVPLTREHVVYRDCSAVAPEPNPPVANLTFKEFQPVRQIRPRIVRSIRDDR